ncbi:MAG: hypothetical protein ACOYBP_08855 [Microbacteriaceae bacterium]
MLKTLTVLALTLLSSVASAQAPTLDFAGFDLRANPYTIGHCTTNADCVARFDATMALLTETRELLTACVATLHPECHSIKRTRELLGVAAKHLSDLAQYAGVKETKAVLNAQVKAAEVREEVRVKQAKEAQAQAALSDMHAWQTAASLWICSEQYALKDGQARMRDQETIERESGGVVDLSARRSAGFAIASAKERLSKAQSFLARHKMKALACSTLYDADDNRVPLDENTLEILKDPDVFLSAE